MIPIRIFSIVAAAVLCTIVVSCSAHLFVLDVETDGETFWKIDSDYYLGNISETVNDDGEQWCLPPAPVLIPETTGFWSTCQGRRLSITFSSDYPQNPISLSVVTYLEGRQYLEITAYEAAGDAGQRIAKIEKTSWNSTSFPVNLNFNWTLNSTISFNTTSIPDKADFIDRIEIEFTDLPTSTIEPTITEPSTTESTTTTKPTNATESRFSTTTEVSNTATTTSQSEDYSHVSEITESITTTATTPSIVTISPSTETEMSSYWLRFIIYFLSAIIIFLLFSVVVMMFINSRKTQIQSPIKRFRAEEDHFEPDWKEGSTLSSIPIPRIDWRHGQSRFY